MSTPNYVKKASANYRNKFDIQQLRLPKGTKEQILAKYGDISINDYIVKLVLNDLAATELLNADAQNEPMQTIQDLQELIDKRKEETKRKSSKRI